MHTLFSKKFRHVRVQEGHKTKKLFFSNFFKKKKLKSLPSVLLSSMTGIKLTFPTVTVLQQKDEQMFREESSEVVINSPVNAKMT